MPTSTTSTTSTTKFVTGVRKIAVVSNLVAVLLFTARIAEVTWSKCEFKHLEALGGGGGAVTHFTDGGGGEGGSEEIFWV